MNLFRMYVANSFALFNIYLNMYENIIFGFFFKNHLFQYR